jgi:hypothetical protein
VKKKLIAGAASLALLAGLITVANPASAANIRLPKTPMNACIVQNGIYCIESVTLTTGSGQKIPLTYVLSGADVPAKKTPTDFFAPIAKVVKGKVEWNDWWMSQYQRDVITSGKMVVLDGSALMGTANHPEQGAIYDPVKKTFDINKPLDSYAYPQQCWDNATRTSSEKTFGECFKGSTIYLLDNEVRFIWWHQTAAEAAKQLITMTSKDSTYIDLSELSALQQRPVRGTTYDATTKTFKETEGIIIPIWVTRDALVNGWAVAGTPATVPAAAATTAPAASTDTSTAAVSTSTEVAPQAPDTATVVNSPTEAGRALPGRWTHPDWQGLNLGALGYDGLYAEAKTPNEFVSSMLFVDVLPTLTGADKRTNLAGQVGNKAYAVSLDSDLVITVKVRVGEMETGVTVAVGVDIVTKQTKGGEYNVIEITGSPVTVPLAKSVKDCEGETGVSKANVRQFQMIALAANDDMSGFGVDGTSGGMYVGTNGVCGLSTPTWDEATKSFSWQVAAPHFAPDGVTVNKGFYKAVIPVADAKLLWGMTNPNDAASALEVSLTTEAGGTAAFIKSISVKSGKIIIDVSNFEYSRPKLKIGIKKSYKPSTAILKKTTITCIKGKTVKKITAVKPACPAGYKKK